MATAVRHILPGAILRSREDATVIPHVTPDSDATKDAKRDDAKRDDECCLMAELSIIEVGRHYFYDGYRFDRLSDAVAYAQVVQGHARHARPWATS